jgi:hypothetical protein
MKSCLFAIGLSCLYLLAPFVRAEEASVPVVLVQLFTSEGCSSCPPADDLLARFAKASPIDGVSIVPMSMHVDYWDHLGWRDPFSSKQFSDYQQSYQAALKTPDIYTPQMIVDGKAAFVGSDEATAKTAIASAARTKKTPLTIDARTTAPGTIEARISVLQPQALPTDTKYDVMLAVTEDELTSDVRRGENSGKKLHHSSVVRSLVRIGVISSSSAAPIVSTLKLDPTWNRQQLHLVAFIQSQKNLSVLGAAITRPAINETAR